MALDGLATAENTPAAEAEVSLPPDAEGHRKESKPTEEKAVVAPVATGGAGKGEEKKAVAAEKQDKAPPQGHGSAAEQPAAVAPQEKSEKKEDAVEPAKLAPEDQAPDGKPAATPASKLPIPQMERQDSEADGEPGDEDRSPNIMVQQSTAEEDVNVTNVNSDAAWGVPAKDPVQFLQQYGYEPLSDAAWKPDVSFPDLQAVILKHVEVLGNTFYVIECVLKAPGREPVEWKCRRRLVHLRQHLHDTVLQDLGREVYLKHFETTPFARRGAPVGTTARLRAWFHTLMSCIGSGVLSPQRISQILGFFEISVPSA